MRPIKFRAWHKQEKKMCRVLALTFPQREQATATLMPYEGPYITCHFDEIELMQFTGVTDKHGKDIYEGDIIVWAGAYDHKLVVRWIEKGLYFDVPLQWIQDIEIIGNIYEHPELMRKQAQ